MKELLEKMFAELDDSAKIAALALTCAMDNEYGSEINETANTIMGTIHKQLLTSEIKTKTQEQGLLMGYLMYTNMDVFK